MPYNLEKSGIKYQGGGGNMASESGDYKRRVDNPGYSGSGLMGAKKGGGLTNLQLAQKAMGGSLTPVKNKFGKEVPGMFQDGGENEKEKADKQDGFIGNNTNFNVETTTEEKEYAAPGGEERRKESDEKYGKRHTRLREKGHQLMQKSDESYDAGNEKKSDRQFKRGKKKFDKASRIRKKKNR